MPRDPSTLSLLFMTFAFVSAYSDKGEFCWRDSYRRGIGRIPGTCAPGREKLGALCYEKCPDNYNRVGLACYQRCPSGFRNDGLFCRHIGGPYKRTGFGRKRGDGVGKRANRKKKERCEKTHGTGNCEKRGLRYYPKCKDGYENHGIIGVCKRKRVDCEALGMGQGVLRLSCRKKIIHTGLDPDKGECEDDEEQKGLLGRCFKKCKDGYKGIGPVCWNQPPDGWDKCGMGAVNPEKNTCGGVIFSQIESVGMLALNVLTFGATKAIDVASDASKFAKMKNDFNKMRNALKKLNEDPGFVKAQETLVSVQLCNDILALDDLDDDSDGDTAKFISQYECDPLDGYDVSIYDATIANDPSTLYDLIREGIDELELLKTIASPNGLDDLGGDLVFNEDDVGATIINVEEMVRISAQMASILDPTGVAGVVSSFTYPKCSKCQ